MESTLIQAIDKLSEKFGIAIDWTQQNIMPQFLEFCDRFITYNIFLNIGLIVLSILLGIASVIIFKKMLFYHETAVVKYEGNFLFDRYGDVDNPTTVILMIIDFCCFIASFPLFITAVGDLLKWWLIPEAQIVQYLTTLIS